MKRKTLENIAAVCTVICLLICIWDLAKIILSNQGNQESNHIQQRIDSLDVELKQLRNEVLMLENHPEYFE